MQANKNSKKYKLFVLDNPKYTSYLFKLFLDGKINRKSLKETHLNYSLMYYRVYWVLLGKEQISKKSKIKFKENSDWKPNLLEIKSTKPVVVLPNYPRIINYVFKEFTYSNNGISKLLSYCIGHPLLFDKTLLKKFKQKRQVSEISKKKAIESINSLKKEIINIKNELNSNITSYDDKNRLRTALNNIYIKNMKRLRTIRSYYFLEKTITAPDCIIPEEILKHYKRYLETYQDKSDYEIKDFSFSDLTSSFCIAYGIIFNPQKDKDINPFIKKCLALELYMLQDRKRFEKILPLIEESIYYLNNSEIKSKIILADYNNSYYEFYENIYYKYKPLHLRLSIITGKNELSLPEIDELENILNELKMNIVQISEEMRKQYNDKTKKENKLKIDLIQKKLAISQREASKKLIASFKEKNKDGDGGI